MVCEDAARIHVTLPHLCDPCCGWQHVDETGRLFLSLPVCSRSTPVRVDASHVLFFMSPWEPVLNTRVTEFVCSCFCPRVAVDQLSCENRADTILWNTLFGLPCVPSRVLLLSVQFCHPRTSQEVWSSNSWWSQNRFKSCPFVFAHIGKALRHLSSPGVTSRVVSFWILYWCCVPDSSLSHRHRLVNSAKNKFVSAHVEPCEDRIWCSVYLLKYEFWKTRVEWTLPCTLCSTSIVWNVRALRRCEFSCVSWETVRVVCVNKHLSRPWPIREAALLRLGWQWCTCDIPGDWDQTETAFRVGQVIHFNFSQCYLRVSSDNWSMCIEPNWLHWSCHRWNRQEYLQYELPKPVQWLCFKNSCQSLGCWIKERNRIFSAQRSNLSPCGRTLYCFLAATRYWKYVFPIIESAVSYRPARRNSRLFLASCFQLLVSEEIPRVVLLLISTGSKSCYPQEYWLRLFSSSVEPNW